MSNFKYPLHTAIIVYSYPGIKVNYMASEHFCEV